MVHGAHDRSGAASDLWQARALAIPNADRLVHASSGRQRIQSDCCLSQLDWRRAASVSVVQVVCRRQSTAARLVAFLFMRMEKLIYENGKKEKWPQSHRGAET